MGYLLILIMIKNNKECLGWFTNFTSIFGYVNLFIFGHMRDFINYITCRNIGHKEKIGYKKITEGFDSFYRRRFYNRIHTAWNRPICSTSGEKLKVLVRKGATKTDISGNFQNAINLASYNYL